jgi:hypothetical protein
MVFYSFTLSLSIDAPNHPVCLGDALRTETKIREIKFRIIDAANFDRVVYWPYHPSPLHKKQIQNGGELFPAFFL